jgi:HK97 gp10 family phage protein
MRWYGEQRHAEIQLEMRRRIAAAVRLVLNQARVLVSTPGTRLRKGKAKVYGAVRSQPGEPPRKQTGQLRRSIATEVLGLIGRVGTNLKYGKHLELGTRHMAARPWLRRALAESRAKITAILSRPIK